MQVKIPAVRAANETRHQAGKVFVGQGHLARASTEDGEINTVNMQFVKKG